MKHVDYSFTESDIDACVFALTQLHLLHANEDISDVQPGRPEGACRGGRHTYQTDKNIRLRGKTEIPCDDLTANETRILCCCITYCHLICQRQIATDEDTYSKCMKYVFSLNNEKPRMTTEEALVELEKEKEQWKGMGNETAILMVAARKQELRFWNEIEGEGI